MEDDIITVFFLDGPKKGTYCVWDIGGRGPYIRATIFPGDFNYNIAEKPRGQIQSYDEIEYRILPYLRFENPYTNNLDYVASINHSLMGI